MAKKYRYQKGDRVLVSDGSRQFKGTIVAVGPKSPRHKDRVYDVAREDGETGGGIKVKGLIPLYGGTFTAWRLFSAAFARGDQKIVRKLRPLKKAR